MAGYTTQNKDSLEPLWDALRKIQSRLRTLEQPTGTQLTGLVGQVQAAIANIAAQLGSLVNAYLSSGFTTGSMTATGNVTVNGTLNAATAIRSAGAAGTDLSLIAGGRQQSWQMSSGGSAGLFGYSPSSQRKKTHWQRVPYTAAQFLACQAYIYEYRGQVDIRDNPRNPNYDPTYKVPLEAGYMAELLVKHGLGQFVVYRDDLAITIDYAGFAAVGMTVIGREHATQIAALMSRLDAAGL